ncbi:MAG: tetratricopeptide repeat protein [Chitinophagales bacterium]
MKKYIFTIIALISSFCAFAQQDTITHVVQRGETLFKLSNIYLIPVDSIAQWNDVENNIIYVGQSLMIKRLNNISDEEIENNINKYHQEDLADAIKENEIWVSELVDSIDLVNEKLDKTNDIHLSKILSNIRIRDNAKDSIANENVRLKQEIEDSPVQYKNDFEEVVVVEVDSKNVVQQDDDLVIESVVSDIEIDGFEEFGNIIFEEDAIIEDVVEEEAFPNTIVEKDTIQSTNIDIQEDLNAQDIDVLEKIEESISIEEEKVEKEKKAKGQKLVIDSVITIEEVITSENIEENVSIEEKISEVTEERVLLAEEKSKKEKKSKEETIEKDSLLAIEVVDANIVLIDSLDKKTAKKSKKKTQNENVVDEILVFEEIEDSLLTNNALPADTLASKKAKKKNKSKDLEIETIIFETAVDSTKKKKQNKKNKKVIDEIVSEKDSLEISASIAIDEVEVVDSKKKKKLKIGDEVDETRKEKARFMLSRAKKEIDKGDLKKALGYIEKSLKQNPSYTDAYMLKADIYASSTHYAEAHNEYIKASQLTPDNAQIHYNIGICLIQLNKKDEAIAAMTQAIETDSTYILAYSGRSALYIEEELYTAAILDYNSILSLNKYFYPALKGRGIAYYNSGEYDAAILDFNQLLEYEPEDGYVYHQRGLAKLYNNDLYGGCMDLLSAVELGETDAEKSINKYCE